MCGSKGTLTEPRLFNLMFKTFMGPVEDQAAIVYLRRNGQGIYVNYLNVLQCSRRRVPFGIAQIGKAFRNEITPGNFIFRTREFEQMEMQYFVKPGTDVEWFELGAVAHGMVPGPGTQPDKLRFHQHGADELAHYAREAFDIQYEFPFGWQEIEGVHNRSDFDLGRHQQYAGKKLSTSTRPHNERYLPYIVETSAGADRVDAHGPGGRLSGKRSKGRPAWPSAFISVAPIKAGVFPLVKKDGMPELATRCTARSNAASPRFYDDSGAIGRRYRRMDEAGTPFCVTIDGETNAARTVTVRHRDSMQQERVGWTSSRRTRASACAQGRDALPRSILRRDLVRAALRGVPPVPRRHRRGRRYRPAACPIPTGRASTPSASASRSPRPGTAGRRGAEPDRPVPWLVRGAGPA